MVLAALASRSRRFDSGPKQGHYKPTDVFIERHEKKKKWFREVVPFVS